MVELNSNQEQRLKDEFQKVDLEQPQPLDLRISPLTVPDFCKDWPTAKAVLQFLVQLPGIPQVAREAISVVIRAGDLAHRVLC